MPLPGTRRIGRIRLGRGSLAGALVLALVLSLVGVAPAQAGPASSPRPPAPKNPVVPVKGTSAPARPRAVDLEEPTALRVAARPEWPSAAAVDVPVAAAVRPTSSEPEISLARAGALPLWVGSPTGAGTVRVELLGQDAVRAAGLTGLLVRLSRRNDAARTQVSIDYSGFRTAYGGDYGSRLQLVRMPDCAATTPAAPGCRAGTPVPSRNRSATGRVEARVPDGLYALTAGPSGGAGSYQATSLSPTATWQVGLQSGDFTWSYPIDTPEVPGVEPDLALTYSSGSIDGRVAANNNQPSWVGEGFELQSGFIERSYKPCSTEPASRLGDLCWGTDNAIVSLPGAAGELVLDDASHTWRMADDDGWRVERFTGAANGDDGDDGDKGEHWRLTAPDGTQYYFGLNRLPGWVTGRAETNSTWTVPVFGKEPGARCYRGTPADAWCQQAYRWNLDYVVDPHGDAMSYYYRPETNHYGRNATATAPTPYVRGGQLDRVEYGQRADTLFTVPAAARVTFATADRCISGSSCVTSQPQNWPDTPLDQACTSSGTCQVFAPTFWSTKRLDRVTTQVYTAGAYRDINSWQLTQSYPRPEDQTSPPLWLDEIRQSGHVGGTTTLPPVTFDGQTWPNRVDTADTVQALYKRRISAVHTETGGRIAVAYAPVQCRPGGLPAEDDNDRRCFPVYWGIGSTSRLEWFHKYAVSQVTEEDLVGGNPPEITSYEYDIGGHAWHHDDAELVPTDHKTWGQWHGYRTVRVRTGAAGGQRSLTEYVFMRGMNGDVNKSGPPDRDVRVDGVSDDPQWSGLNRVVTTYDGDGGPWLQRRVSALTGVRATAARQRAGLQPLTAYLVTGTTERILTALSDGSTRTTETNYGYDPDYAGMTRVEDRGDLADPDDDTCTRTWYTRNLDRWITDTVSRTETVAVGCAATPAYPDDLISDERGYYDGQLAWGAPPIAGDETRSEQAGSWSGGPVYVTAGSTEVDRHGRPTAEVDALGSRSTIAYTPALGGPTTQVSTTNALGHTTTSTLDPLLGSPVSAVDANGRRTDLTYDALGRLRQVWLPGRAKDTQSPNSRFEYVVRADGTSATRAETLTGDAGGGYRSAYTLYDGFLRPRQTQTASPAGGRIITDTFHDGHGRVERTYDDYWEASRDPVPELFRPTGSVPSETRYGYDGADRETVEIFLSHGVEQWRTGTAYGGDRTSVDPPDGGTATTTVVDADDRVTALRQYTGGSPTGAYDETRYTYTKGGELATVTDPAGNVWRYSYDLRGRRIHTEDPDSGTSTSRYDDEDQLISVTDARGHTVANTYDPLGRPTGRYDGSPDGTKLADWTYDTLPGGTGMPTAATRYAGGDTYRTETLGYDPAGRPTGTAATVPAATAGQTERYASTFGYNAAGAVTSASLPAVGSLGAETVTYTYNSLGLPARMTSRTGSGGSVTYVNDTAYDPLGDVESYQLGGPDAVLLRAFGYETGSRRLSTAQAVGVSTEDVTMVSDVNYRYDDAGNITSIADAAVGDTQCFRTDHLRRLTEAWTATDDCAGEPSPSVLGGPAAYWQSYRFDKVGNRTEEVRHAAGGDTRRTYGYPDAGAAQPHTLRSVTTAGPAGNRTDTFGYDSDGNTTTRAVAGKDQTLTWDTEGNLTAVTEDGRTTSFGYDADGNRVLRRDATGTTYFLGDAELFRPAGGGGALGTRYYGQDGDVVAVRAADNRLSWLVDDHNGTAAVAVDAATLTATRRYSLPYGGSRGPATSNWPGQRGFVGGTLDTGIGLVRVGAREYDPDTGRFLSVDPVIDESDPQQMHGYAYANNSPVTYSDPDGLRPDCGTGKGCTQFNKTHRYNGKKYVKKPKPKPKVKAVRRPAAGPKSARDRLLAKDKQLDNRDKRGKVKPKKAKAPKSARDRLLDKDAQLDARDKRATSKSKPIGAINDAVSRADKAEGGFGAAADSKGPSKKELKKQARSGNPSVREPAKTALKSGQGSRGFLAAYGDNPLVRHGGDLLGPASDVLGVASDIESGMPAGKALQKFGFKKSVEFVGTLLGVGLGSLCGPAAPACMPVFGFLGEVAGDKVGDMIWRD
ncbi:RHS repeat-associated core domain-containing protein [Micromonospora sp. NPDC049274]|uniref:RHS repeat-associated core domain-containing protein n=1 Tax=Micromonospora sp. NPDC049274 TaxID=3154829 RepID=UPI003436600A